MLYFKYILIVSYVFNLNALKTQWFPLVLCNMFKCFKLHSILLFPKAKPQNASYPLIQKIDKILVFACHSFLQIRLSVQGSGELLKISPEWTLIAKY